MLTDKLLGACAVLSTARPLCRQQSLKSPTPLQLYLTIVLYDTSVSALYSHDFSPFVLPEGFVLPLANKLPHICTSTCCAEQEMPKLHKSLIESFTRFLYLEIVLHDTNISCSVPSNHDFALWCFQKALSCRRVVAGQKAATCMHCTAPRMPILLRSLTLWDNNAWRRGWRASRGLLCSSGGWIRTTPKLLLLRSVHCIIL